MMRHRPGLKGRIRRTRLEIRRETRRARTDLSALVSTVDRRIRRPRAPATAFLAGYCYEQLRPVIRRLPVTVGGMAVLRSRLNRILAVLRLTARVLGPPQDSAAD